MHTITAGGKPSKATPADKRIKENKGKKPAFPGAAPPFKAPAKKK